MKSDGIRTLVRKLRLCQSARGRRPTRVERLFSAPFAGSLANDVAAAFFRKRNRHVAQPYKLHGVNQNLSP